MKLAITVTEGCATYQPNPERGIYRFNPDNNTYSWVDWLDKVSCTYAAISWVKIEDVIDYCQERTTTTTEEAETTTEIVIWG